MVTCSIENIDFGKPECSVAEIPEYNKRYETVKDYYYHGFFCESVEQKLNRRNRINKKKSLRQKLRDVQKYPFPIFYNLDTKELDFIN